MKYILLLLIVVCSCAAVHALGDTIAYRNTLLGTTYKKNGHRMNLPMLRDELRPDAVASMQFRRGQNMHYFAVALSCVAGTCIGYELSNVVSDDDVHQGVLWGGVAMCASAFTLDIVGLTKIKRAVRTYNANKHQTGRIGFQPELNLAVSGQGIGVVLRF